MGQDGRLRLAIPWFWSVETVQVDLPQVHFHELSLHSSRYDTKLSTAEKDYSNQKVQQQAR